MLHASDGGVATRRTRVYDAIRGTPGWPAAYGGRGVLNDTFWDSEKGMSEQENRMRYGEAVERGDEGWGSKREGNGGVEGGRMCTYAGTGVGLVRGVKGAGEVVEEVRRGLRGLLRWD